MLLLSKEACSATKVWSFACSAVHRLSLLPPCDMAATAVVDVAVASYYGHSIDDAAFCRYYLRMRIDRS